MSWRGERSLATTCRKICAVPDPKISICQIKVVELFTELFLLSLKTIVLVLSVCKFRYNPLQFTACTSTGLCSEPHIFAANSSSSFLDNQEFLNNRISYKKYTFAVISWTGWLLNEKYYCHKNSKSFKFAIQTYGKACRIISRVLSHPLLSLKLQYYTKHFSRHCRKMLGKGLKNCITAVEKHWKSIKQIQVNVCVIQWHHVLDTATLCSNMIIFLEIILHYGGLETL